MQKNGVYKEEQFEDLFRKNYRSLFLYALDWVDDEEISKDLVSDLFADVWQKMDTIRMEEADAYLRRSMRNKCINYLQHMVVERKFQDYYLKMKLEVLDEFDELHEERIMKVNAVMDSLSAQRRFIFEQCVLERKSYREVAEIVGLTVSSVHKHVSRVYALLREKVTD